MKLAAHLCASIALSLLPEIAAAQETTAEKTADIALEQARFNLLKSQLDALATLRSQTGSTAEVTGGADSAEAMLLREAAFKGAVDKLVESLSRSKDYSETPVIVMGNSPPSVSEWLAFHKTAQNVSTSITEANTKWAKVKKSCPKEKEFEKEGASDGKIGTMSVELAIPMVVSAITTAVSALRVDSTIKGSPVKITSTTLETMLALSLDNAGYGIDYDDFAIDKGGAEAADALLTGFQMGKNDKAVTDLGENRGNYVALKACLTKGAIGAKGEVDPSKLGADAEKSYAAGESLMAAKSSYDALLAEMLSAKNGITNATLITRQKKWASGNTKTIQILDSEAALTTINRKTMFGGIGNTPLKLRMVVRMDYVATGFEAKPKGSAKAAPIGRRGNILCLAQAGYDKILLQPLVKPDCVSSSSLPDTHP